MKFASAILSFAVISAEAVDLAESNPFRRSLHDVKSKVVRTKTTGYGRTGGDLDSEECAGFVERVSTMFPELASEDIIVDPTLYVCNPIAFEVIMEHYSAGFEVTSEEGEPQECIYSFFSLMLGWMSYLESIPLEGFCDYVEMFDSELCEDLEVSELEYELLRPITPEEVTEICYDGDYEVVGKNYEDAIGGPHEYDACVFAMKQLLVDEMVKFHTLAEFDPACESAVESRAIEGRACHAWDIFKWFCAGSGAEGADPP